MPVLNRKGKIQLEEKSKIAMCSSGSGGFFKGLHKQGIMKILKKTKIKYINSINTNNFNVKVADPFIIGLFSSSSTDSSIGEIEVITEIYEKENTLIENPVILQNSEGGVDMFYIEDANKAMSIDGALFPKYETLDLNFFTTTNFLETSLDREGAELFKDRLKRKRNVPLCKLDMNENFASSEEKLYSFELNIFNLAKLAKNVKLVLRNREDLILMKNGPKAKNFNEKEAIEKLKKFATEQCSIAYGEDLGKF